MLYSVSYVVSHSPSLTQQWFYFERVSVKFRKPPSDRTLKNLERKLGRKNAKELGARNPVKVTVLGFSPLRE